MSRKSEDINTPQYGTCVVTNRKHVFLFRSAHWRDIRFESFTPRGKSQVPNRPMTVNFPFGCKASPALDQLFRATGRDHRRDAPRCRQTVTSTLMLQVS
jgi:hypothetical protein